MQNKGGARGGKPHLRSFLGGYIVRCHGKSPGRGFLELLCVIQWKITRLGGKKCLLEFHIFDT